MLITITVLVFAAAAPVQDDGLIQQFAAPKFAAQAFLLVGKDGKTYRRLYTKGDRPLLEFYDSRGAVICSAPPSGGRLAQLFSAYIATTEDAPPFVAFEGWVPTDLDSGLLVLVRSKLNMLKLGKSNGETFEVPSL